MTRERYGMQVRMSPPEVETSEHPNYRTINVNGVFGGHRAMFFEIVVYSDELKATKALSSAQVAPDKSTVKRTLECRLLIDPYQAKSIALWLNQHVAEYEKLFGRIPSPEELNAKAGNPDKSDLL